MRGELFPVRLKDFLRVDRKIDTLFPLRIKFQNNPRPAPFFIPAWILLSNSGGCHNRGRMVSRCSSHKSFICTGFVFQPIGMYNNHDWWVRSIPGTVLAHDTTYGDALFSFLEYRGHYSRQFVYRQSRRLSVRRDWQQHITSLKNSRLPNVGSLLTVGSHL